MNLYTGLARDDIIIMTCTSLPTYGEVQLPASSAIDWLVLGRVTPFCWAIRRRRPQPGPHIRPQPGDRAHVIDHPGQDQLVTPGGPDSRRKIFIAHGIDDAVTFNAAAVLLGLTFKGRLHCRAGQWPAFGAPF